MGSGEAMRNKVAHTNVNSAKDTWEENHHDFIFGPNILHVFVQVSVQPKLQRAMSFQNPHRNSDVAMAVALEWWHTEIGWLQGTMRHEFPS